MECTSPTESQEVSASAPSLSRALSAPLACDDPMQFETFAASVQCRDLPVVVFTDDVTEQRIWHNGSVAKGRVHRPHGRADVVQRDPVVMSCAFLGFAIEPYEKRYLHYRSVGMVFSRPHHGEFMQPSIDTFLVCHALGLFLDRAKAEGRSFRRLIDIGAGSGFIGKFAASLAPDAREVCLVDIDSAAKQYWQTPEFGSSGVPDVQWDFQVGDACPLLERDPNYDLLMSNPPYIPTRAEASEEAGVSHVTSFWEGCGLLVHLLQLMCAGKHPESSHLVVAMTSLTLKSRQVCNMLAAMPAKGIRVRVLLEREIAWKAWYAGRGSGPEYLIANATETADKQQIGEQAYFVGCCKPGESRTGGERDKLWGYHWHVAYILDIYREPNGPL